MVTLVLVALVVSALLIVVGLNGCTPLALLGMFGVGLGAMALPFALFFTWAESL